jgi:hypothetical protein
MSRLIKNMKENKHDVLIVISLQTMIIVASVLVFSIFAV